MTFSGLSVESHGKGGGRVVTHFAIPVGKEAASGQDVLACLAAGFEVCLRNDLDEGGEGCTLFKRSASGLLTKVAGHGWGWSSEWKPIDEAGVLAAVARLADLNRGGHWSAQGSLSRVR
jgi:hypothetical protein